MTCMGILSIICTSWHLKYKIAIHNVKQIDQKYEKKPY